MIWTALSGLQKQTSLVSLDESRQFFPLETMHGGCSWLLVFLLFNFFFFFSKSPLNSVAFFFPERDWYILSVNYNPLSSNILKKNNRTILSNSQLTSCRMMNLKIINFIKKSKKIVIKKIKIKLKIKGHLTFLDRRFQLKRILNFTKTQIIIIIIIIKRLNSILLFFLLFITFIHKYSLLVYVAHALSWVWIQGVNNVIASFFFNISHNLIMYKDNPFEPLFE
jgi:hypothetical protein